MYSVIYMLTCVPTYLTPPPLYVVANIDSQGLSFPSFFCNLALLHFVPLSLGSCLLSVAVDEIVFL